jgi:hypothetical protein
MSAQSTTHPHTAPRLKKEYSYTYTPPPYIRGLFYGELYLYLYSPVSQWSHSLTPRHYNPCRVLADSRSRLQPSLSLALILQFLTPNLPASLITPSNHPSEVWPSHSPSALRLVRGDFSYMVDYLAFVLYVLPI